MSNNIPKYQSPWQKIANIFNKSTKVQPWEQQYINQSPLVKYNPQTPNVPGPKTFFTNNLSKFLGGLTSINAAPMAVTGMSYFSKDGVLPPPTYHIEWDSSKGGFVAVDDTPKSNTNKKVKTINTVFLNGKQVAYDQKVEKNGRVFYRIDGKWHESKKTAPKTTNTQNTEDVTDTESTSAITEPQTFADYIAAHQQDQDKWLQDNGYIKKPVEEATKQGQEPEVTAKPNTYESLVEANKAAFNNGINDAYWRRQFRKDFNKALANGDVYNKNTGQGTQVFDINGLDANEILSTYWTPGKGLTRKNMRKIMKNYNKPSSDKLNAGRNTFYGGKPEANTDNSTLTNSSNLIQPINPNIFQFDEDSIQQPKMQKIEKFTPNLQIS